jgi:integrase
MKFTDKFILNLKATDKLQDVREGKGFGIRVTPGGVKTWFFIYRFDGKRRFMNLGHYPGVSLTEANKRYRAACDLYEQGKDPLTLADQTQDERRKAPTVADLVSEYIEKHAKVHKRSWQEDERILNKEVLPIWGKRKAVDITKRDVVLLLEKIMERGAPGMSNNTFQVVRKMFNFAVERDILTYSPATGVKALAPKIVRERALSVDEIKTLWGELDNAAISDEIKRTLKLILITAQRPGEVIGMHTSEIDGHWWTIPSERSKNGKAHRVYLTATALEIINAATEDAKQGLIRYNLRMQKEGKPEVPITDPYSGYIFPCPHKGKGQPIDSHAVAIAVHRNLAWPLTDTKGKPLYTKDGKPATENRLGIDHFTPHDLRRTAATFMSQIGFMDEIIDAVLNHAKQGIIKTYNLNKYDAEKQQALEAWERKLCSIITGAESKVIPIMRKAA